MYVGEEKQPPKMDLVQIINHDKGTKGGGATPEAGETFKSRVKWPL